MKNSINISMGRIAVVITLVFTQFVFAGDLIRRDNTDPGSMPLRVVNTSIFTEKSMIVDNITVEVVAGNLVVNFNTQIGIAKISITNEVDKIVFSTAVNTNFSADVIVPAKKLGNGEFLVEVAYGSTVFSKTIKL